jgi:hypothetical protein
MELSLRTVRRQVAIGTIWSACGVIVCTAALLALFCRGVPRYDVALFAWPFLLASGLVAMIVGFPISLAVEGPGRSLRNIFAAALVLTVTVVLLVGLLSFFIKPVSDCAPGMIPPQSATLK